MIVVGLGFGDEGKGLTTSFLCAKMKEKNPIVVRFNGGHQAGHTVVHQGERHVFSSFGSGTLQGVPTFWSKYCTFEPIGFLTEHALLKDPKIIVDPLCPVTTPFDIFANQSRERLLQHGSVGVGFGTTIARHENHQKLVVRDLLFPEVTLMKLRNIAEYHQVEWDAKVTDEFMDAAAKSVNNITISSDAYLSGKTPIFEGAQGILLDMDFGFFPHVTRSNTTTKNALEMHYGAQEVYYVTRSYLTRHGNGPLPGEKKLVLKNNLRETNQSHEYQGHFRTADLSVELLNYALSCDNHFSGALKKNLVITCMDQYEIDVKKLLSQLSVDFDNVYLSYGEEYTDIRLFR